MKKTVFFLMVILMLVGCEKNEKKNCIYRYYTDGESSLADSGNVYSIDNLYELYIVEFSDKDCEKSEVEQIMSHNGDTVRVYGHFRDDFTGNSRWLLFDDETSISVNNPYNVDFDPVDTSIEYVASCKLNIYVQGLYSAKKEDAANSIDCFRTHIDLDLLDAKEKEEKQ